MKAADVIRLCARLVPRDRRDTWRRQWDADLQCQAAFLAAHGHDDAYIRRDLLARSAGAARHALWFRLRQWRSLMILQDVRYAARGLRQRPGFTTAIVLTLGLAIGANATIFSWIDALVFNPLPAVPRASELVVTRFATATRSNLSFSYPNYVDVRDSRPSGLKGIAVHDLLPVSLRIDGGSERAWAELASGNIFDVLEVGAAAGRTLHQQDESARAQVAVISHRLWQTRFGSRADTIGRAITINAKPFTIVGVAAERFRGGMNGISVDLWLPVTVHGVLSGRSSVDERGSGWLTSVARKSAGASDEEVQASLSVVADRLARDHEVNAGRTLRVSPLRTAGAAQVLLPVLTIVMAVVAIVLVIACANVSGLLVARAVSRRQEVTIRAALGASRLQLARQLLIESLLLAVMGGAAGTVLAVWTSRGLDRLLPPLPFPIAIGASVNVRVLMFSAAAVVLCTILFGLAPALYGSRSQLQGTLRSARGSSHARARVRRVLVAAQVALAMVLLVSAGLFARTLANAYDVDPGFSRRNGILASLDVTTIGYKPDQGRTFFNDVLARVRALPGVEAASFSTMVPLSIGGGADTSPVIEGYTPAEHEDMTVYYGMVADDYFRTMGIGIREGRAIEARDHRDAAPVAVINETMARKYWKGRSAIGGRFKAGDEWTTVVGVAADGKYGTLSEAPLPVMYFPIQQAYRPDPVLHVATVNDAAPSIAEVRKAIAGLTPDLALFDVRTLEEHLQISVTLPRIAATLLGIFGALALALAAVGLYGVISFAASQRTQEIGVRMALGADRGGILRQILGEGVKLSAIGLAVGTGAALLATPLIESQLVNVSPADAVTFVSTALLLLAVALVASFLPALRASRLDPVEALRTD